MATAHPYISGAGNLAQMINHLKKNFPTTVSAETVKKLGIASNNESYVINALQFIGVLDEDGKRTERGVEVFSHREENEFQQEFKKLLQKAYTDLYELHGDDMWTLDREELTNYFRKTDKTSDAIGQRQAAVFQTFASLAGHGEAPAKMKTGSKKKAKLASALPSKSKKAAAKTTGAKEAAEAEEPETPGKRDFALTVRIEINLPADGSKETYDNIFKSIKANLLDD